jgi:hypothetical protein
MERNNPALAMCQDRYLETRSHVQEALPERRQAKGFNLKVRL